MNEVDKKRFARYRPGYIEPQIQEDEDTINNENKNSEKVKDTLGFVEKIDIDPNDLINQILAEMENSKTT